MRWRQGGVLTRPLVGAGGAALAAVVIKHRASTAVIEGGMGAMRKGLTTKCATKMSRHGSLRAHSILLESMGRQARQPPAFSTG